MTREDLNKLIRDYFIKLEYDGFFHKYTCEGRIMTSVSKIVKAFIAPVNWNQKAQGVAYKTGVTVGKVKRNWDYERDISIVQGHKTHSFGELLGPGCGKPETNQERALVKFWSNVDKQRYIRVAREVR